MFARDSIAYLSGTTGQICDPSQCLNRHDAGEASRNQVLFAMCP